MKKILILLAFVCTGSLVQGQVQFGLHNGINAYAQEVGYDIHFSAVLPPAALVRLDWLSGIYVGADVGYSTVRVARTGAESRSISLAVKGALKIPFGRALALHTGSYVGGVFGESSLTGTATLGKGAFYFEPFGELQWWIHPQWAAAAALGLKNLANGDFWERSVTLGFQVIFALPLVSDIRDEG